MVKSILLAIGKIVLLAVVAMLLTIVVGQMLPLRAALQQAPTELPMVMLMVFAVQIVYAALFYAAAVQSDLAGWRLYLALFCVYYGFQVIMMQSESELIIFIQALAPLTVSDVYRMALNSLATIVFYLAVVLFLAGRWRGRVAPEHRPAATLFNRHLIWKIALVALIYPAVYFGFGWMVAWQFAAVRDYYATPPIIYDQFVLTLIQVGRGVGWALLGLPIFLMFHGNTRAIVFSMLFYAALSGVVLLVPSVFMPPTVRMAHLLEILSSMLLYGLIVGLVMAGWGRAPRSVGRAVTVSG